MAARARLLATFETSHTLCLQDGVRSENRKNITVDGTSMPVGIASYNWASARIEVEIFRILVEEALGFHSVQAVLSTSTEGLFLISGCTCALTGECFGPDPKCDQKSNRWHICLGSWDGYDLSAKTYVRTYAPDQYPEDLGSLGYLAWDAMFITQKTVDEAFTEMEAPLEYYRGYNVSHDLTQFFASVKDIPLHRLMPCNETRFMYTDEIELYLRWTGDSEGVVSGHNESYYANCSHAERWWLAPACRHNVSSCIPFITGGAGWGIVQMMSKATSHHLPVAMAVATDAASYNTIPYDFTTSFYWWYPDSLFTLMSPVAVIFPPHNVEEWTQGHWRTMSRGDFIKKYAWNELAKAAAGEPLRALAKALKFTYHTMDRLLELFARLQNETGKLAAEAGYEVACDWLRRSQETWKAWVPLQTNCEAGQGLIRDAAEPDSFVNTRAEASSCYWCSPGRHSSPIADADGETFTCQPCPAGQFTTWSGRQSCKNCRAGKFKDRASPEDCVSCQPGRAAELKGQTACAPCPLGSVSAREGEVRCMACSNGTFAAEEGLRSCSLCMAGRYATSAGSSACARCDDVLAGSTNTRGSASEEECACPPGKYMSLEDGCTACPRGLLCPGGNGEPLQRPGFWVDLLREPSARLRRYAAHTYKCRDEQECPGGSLGLCALHRRGTACNNCEDGYFPTDGGDCQLCTSQSMLPFLAGLLLLPALLLCVVLLATSDASRQHLSLISVGCIAGQLVMSMQILTAMQKVRIDFPEPLSGLLHVLVLITSFDLLHLPCILTTDTPVTRFAVLLLAYPFFASILFCTAGLLKLVGRPIDRAVLLNANGLMILFAYIIMTLQVMLPFQCQENPGGFLSMVTEPGLKCFEDADHIALSSLGVVGVLVYPGFITAWVTYATLNFRFNVRSAEGLSRLRGYRFLFARFKAERYYFGLVILVRNCIVASIPILLVRLPGLQILALVLVLLAASILQAKCWPWRTEIANVAELTLIVGMTAIGAGIGVLLHDTERELSSMLGWTICVLIGIMMLTALGALLRQLCYRIWPAKRFGIFLCHHKAGAGVLCRLLKTLMACKSTSIFLDSDYLDDLDTLFDIVRCNVSNLIVVLSQSVLSRPWCAGEIVTAHCNGVNIAVLLCEDFSKPEHSALQHLVNDWSTDEFSILAAFDITRQMVFEAYCHVLNIQHTSLSRFEDLPTKQSTVMKLVADCCGHTHGFNSMLSRRPLSTRPKQPVVLITGAIDEGEWLVSCELMQVLLEQHLELETEVLRDSEVQTLPSTSRLVVVLLSQGLLRDPTFARTLLAISDPGETNPTNLHILTALADGSFQFPGADFYIELEKAGLGLPCLGPDEGPRLAAAYSWMLSTLSRPFTPLASERTIQGQVAEISFRARQLLKQPPAMQCGPKWSRRQQGVFSLSVPVGIQITEGFDEDALFAEFDDYVSM